MACHLISAKPLNEPIQLTVHWIVRNKLPAYAVLEINNPPRRLGKLTMNYTSGYPKSVILQFIVA